jgi:hypothetical protein
MGNPIPAQHPAVVLRSHFQLVRALLVAATIAVVGLSVWVVILATDADQPSKAASSAQSLRYGGSNPATGRPQSIPLQQEHPVKDYSMNSATGDSGGDPAQKPERAQQSENGPGARTH